LQRRFPGQDVDVADFARVNRAALLTALAGSGQLRAIARASCPDAPGSDELLAALLGDDGAVAAAAAAKLAAGPEVLAPPRASHGQRAIAVTAAPSRPGKDAGTGRQVGDVRLLVDAGTRPRPGGSDVGPPDMDVAVAEHLDAIVITHAHNDHAGYVPALTSRYESMPVYCTADTAALLPTMWGDSVKVFERSRAERAAHGDLTARPPYTQADATAAMRRVQTVPFGRETEVADGVTIELFPAGHILGAAGVVITAGSSRVVITGDVSDLAQASVSGLVVPDSARNADLLVIESAYCRPGGKPRDHEVDRFILTVAETVKTGRVLVPAFALGRAQEVLLTLRDRLPDVPVLVDGMAKEISRIYEAQTAGPATR
jgi:Cft2 family RNA processing exonuclease